MGSGTACLTVLNPSGWWIALVGIRELARHLEISIGTVSRALNGRADVNALTRQRVRDAAAKLGYSPNQSGRSLRRGQTDLVGVIIPGGADDAPINMVFLFVLAGLKRRLSDEGLDLAIFLEEEGEDRLEPLRRVTERGFVDALIIADTVRCDPRVDYLRKLDKPFVAFGRTHSPIRHAWIDPDFEAAVEGAVDYLAQLGHRRIALALPDLATNYIELIERSYRRAMRRRGFRLDEAWDLRPPAGERGGLAAAEAVLASNPRPTAVLLSDSMHAVAFYRRLGEAGLLPGRDLSIVGILPEARARSLIPALTSYQTDWRGIGRSLGEAVILELAQAARGRKPGGGAPQPPARRPMRLKAKVEFRPGESVCRLDAP
jgi:DNA-binding LacI/PurR family transcriptional regulator